MAVFPFIPGKDIYMLGEDKLGEADGIVCARSHTHTVGFN